MQERLRVRHVVRAAVRAYFDAQQFLEVEPPTLVKAPGLEPHIAALRVRVDDGRTTAQRWLHTSPEYYMKRLLAAGAERIYTLCRVFRVGEHGPHHRVEFTMLEWYRANAPYTQLMADCEALLAAAACALHGHARVGDLDLAAPYERLTIAEAFQRHAGVDPLRFVQPPDGPGLRRAARDSGIPLGKGPADEDPVSSFERAFYEIMLARVEPAIGRTRPTFLYEWPAPLAALSRISEKDPRVAERVELYAGGVELGNGFGELTDAEEQRRRFREDQQRRARLGKPVYAIDEQFLCALRKMPPSCGMAVGLDRMVMLCAQLDDLGSLAALAEP
jgi:lysyl-tRNA synthetase class 2